MSDVGDWDARYAEKDRWWSGEVNATLVAETEALPAGRALDVGCGEGADAIWLASRGWVVEGFDISQVALDRAAAAAAEAGVEVTWRGVDILESPPPAGAFDLVTVHYPALPKTPGDDAVRALVSAVAPGGTLLVVGHDFSAHGGHHGGFDAADFVQPPDVAAHLEGDDGWTIEVLETRPRTPPPGFQGPDVPDVVLRARRR